MELEKSQQMLLHFSGVARNPIEDGVRVPRQNPNSVGQPRHTGQSHGAGNEHVFGNERAEFCERVSLETALLLFSFQVVILSDPDSHEICFVGSEAFDELSQVDPKADDLLDGAMAKDKSKEWFQKKGIEKGKA